MWGTGKDGQIKGFQVAVEDCVSPAWSVSRVFLRERSVGSFLLKGGSGSGGELSGFLVGFLDSM